MEPKLNVYKHDVPFSTDPLFLITTFFSKIETAYYSEYYIFNKSGVLKSDNLFIQIAGADRFVFYDDFESYIFNTATNQMGTFIEKEQDKVYWIRGLREEECWISLNLDYSNILQEISKKTNSKALKDFIHVSLHYNIILQHPN